MEVVAAVAVVAAVLLIDSIEAGKPSLVTTLRPVQQTINKNTRIIQVELELRDGSLARKEDGHK